MRPSEHERLLSLLRSANKSVSNVNEPSEKLLRRRELLLSKPSKDVLKRSEERQKRKRLEDRENLRTSSSFLTTASHSKKLRLPPKERQWA